MAEGYQLGRNAARSLAKSQQRTRAESYSTAAMPRRVGGRQVQKSVVVGVAQEDIPGTAKNGFFFDPGFMSKGRVRVLFSQFNGALTHSFEFLEAFNLTEREVVAGSIVSLNLDWRTGRWLIIYYLGPAVRIYIKGLSSFGHGDATFSAQLVNYFDGVDPRGTKWSAGGVDNVINPPTSSGQHFFAGDVESYGFAQWHDADAVTPGSPEGYWCYQLQCAA